MTLLSFSTQLIWHQLRHSLKVNSIISFWRELSAHHIEIILFKDILVESLLCKMLEMSTYFDQKWLRSEVFCSMSTSCNFLPPQRSQTGKLLPHTFSGKNFSKFSFHRDDQHIIIIAERNATIVPKVHLLYIASTSEHLADDDSCIRFMSSLVWYWLRREKWVQCNWVAPPPW